MPETAAPLKILHTSLGRKGAGFLHQLAGFATDHNHIAYIATPEATQTDDILRAGGVHVPFQFAEKRRALNAPFAGYKLAKHVRKNGIDLIHSHDAATYQTAIWAGKFSKTPVVITADTMQPKGLLSKVAGIVAPSKYLAENLPAKYVHVCPPSFDPKVLNAKEIDAKAVDTLWSEWDVPAATTVILTTEPLEEGNGYRRFIEALGSMKKLPFKAIICADYGEKQPLFTELWRRIDELGLSNSILFIDKPTTAAAMKNILAASDVVVFPNRNPLAENQSVVHAQAMGKAVIVCTPGNRAEIVVSGETGWLMSLNNDDTAHQKLALAMTDAITDITRLQKMGTSATRHCKEHYQNTQTLTDLFAFYESLRNACKK